MRGFVRSHPVAAYLALAIALSWLAWLPLLLADWGVIGRAPTELHLLGSLGPAAAAFLITAAAHGRAGIVAIARRAIQLRSSGTALLAALGGAALVFIGALAGNWLQGAPSPTLASFFGLAEYPWMTPLIVVAAQKSSSTALAKKSAGGAFSFRALRNGTASFWRPRSAASHGRSGTSRSSFTTRATRVSAPFCSWGGTPRCFSAHSP